MNIDLKSTPTESAVQEMARLVKMYNRQDVTIWGAVSDKTREMLQEADPTVPTFYSVW
jgi:RNase P/RNase MRP subunit p29